MASLKLSGYGNVWPQPCRNSNSMSSKLLGLVTQNWILGLGYSADQIDWLLDWAIRLGYSAWLLSLYLDILLGYSTLGLLGWDTLLDGRSSRDCCWGGHWFCEQMDSGTSELYKAGSGVALWLLVIYILISYERGSLQLHKGVWECSVCSAHAWCQRVEVLEGYSAKDRLPQLRSRFCWVASYRFRVYSPWPLVVGFFWPLDLGLILGSLLELCSRGPSALDTLWTTFLYNVLLGHIIYVIA